MTGSRDRILEEALVELIDAASSAAQCVPSLLAGGESNAVVPRVVVKCESQPTPDFQHTPDGIYGIHPINVVITSIAEARRSTSSSQMEDMNSAVDEVLIYNGGLAAALTSGTLTVYGVIPRGCKQKRTENRIMRERYALIWARLESSSEPMLYEDGTEMLYEDGTTMYYE